MIEYPIQIGPELFPPFKSFPGLFYMQTEQQIQKLCLTWLQCNGFFAWKNHVGPIQVGAGRKIKNPAKGSPDIIAIKDGKFFGFEIKKPGKKMSADQITWAKEARQYGAVVLCVSSLQELIDDFTVYEAGDRRF